ncbi:MAG: sulfite exporter TauE/SafE family protein [Candidatus Goldiibacteriota bacterium]
MSKKMIIIAVWTGVVLGAVSLQASNPFIEKTEKKSSGSIVENDFFKKIVIMQAKLNREVSKKIEYYKENKSYAAGGMAALLLFVYGLLHALGPGHGKTVISAWVVSSKKIYSKVVLVSVLSALFHALSAVIIVSAGYFFLKGIVFTDTAAVRNTMMLAAGILLLLIGIYMLWSLFSSGKKQDSRAAAELKNKKDINPVLLALVIGLVPCPSTSVILIFAFGFGLIAEGYLFILAFASGMAVTQVVIASGVWHLREKAESLVSGRFEFIIEKILPAAAAAVLMAAGFFVVLPYLY